MTDNEIIKAEELVYKFESLLCYATGGKLSYYTYPLDIMERYVDDNIQKYCEEAQSEAVKEFAENVVEKVEKARQKYQRLCKEQGEEEDEAMNIIFRGIINIVKEMVGENNDR